MINIKDLTNDDIGRKVVYSVEFCEETEEGEQTSWNSRFIFVRFKGPTGEACTPENVSFTFE